MSATVIPTRDIVPRRLHLWANTNTMNGGILKKRTQNLPLHQTFLGYTSRLTENGNIWN